MKFFEHFPKIQYQNVDGIKLATDITRRFRVIDTLKKRLELFYDYTIKAGETPAIVADKFYGDMKYEYVILLFNDILDPYYGWPMTDEVFEKYIEKKYGSVTQTMQTVHTYYHIVNEEFIDFNGNKIEKQKYAVDYQTYLQLDDYEREIEYLYDYEYRINDEKKNIKILDSIYLNLIEAERENIFNE